MKISSKLMFIVALTIFGAGLSIWSVLEVSKGGRFHQLNLLHLKYNTMLHKQISAIENGAELNILTLTNTITHIRDQPVECLDQVNVLDKLVMRQIGTIGVLELCIKDLQVADNALNLLKEYEQGNVTNVMLMEELKSTNHIFNEHSHLFEEPVTNTVSFIVSTMVPLVIVISILISIFNITFITLMSRNITGSINSVITLLTNKDNKENVDVEIKNKVSGELKTLLEVAKNRLTDEVLMAEVNKKLEYMVEQRTVSLTRANEELALFAYRASHDLKAPLSSTKNLARFIIQDINDGKLDRAKQDVTKIANQMSKLEDLVVGILALTEADSVDKEHTEIDLSAMLADIQTRSSELLNMNNCSFETSIQLNSTMKSQSIRIIQIIENLVTNGIKYCDPNKSELFVKVNVSENEQSYIINVEDNGLGIPIDRQDETFQMFKRFHPTKSFGSGLGMSIVKKHIDYMCGTIDMASSALGTNFTVTLPKENAE